MRKWMQNLGGGREVGFSTRGGGEAGFASGVLWLVSPPCGFGGWMGAGAVSEEVSGGTRLRVWCGYVLFQVEVLDDRLWRTIGGRTRDQRLGPLDTFMYRLSASDKKGDQPRRWWVCSAWR